MVTTERNWEEIESGFDQIGMRTPAIADLRLTHPDRPLSTAEQIADRIADALRCDVSASCPRRHDGRLDLLPD
jgi:hypothetical protein